MSKKKELTLKQQNFADEYIITGNASEAYKKVYKNVKKDATARANSSRLLANANVSAYIAERMEELKTERVADQQEIMEYLTSVLRGEAKGTALVGEGMGEQSVRQVAPTVAEKTSAAINLGKRYAMWTEKQQVENITPTFVDDVPEDD